MLLRITRRKGEKGDKKEYGFIDVLKHEIKLPVDLINLFIYCVIDLKKKKLFCYTETKDGNLEEIKRINFKLKNVIYLGYHSTLNAQKNCGTILCPFHTKHNLLFSSIQIR